MTAIRGKNLRSGDLAEQLGLLLLQQMALVAPVPRTEDIGIDAVVTLIKDFDKRRLIAEDSIFVQIKSASVENIEYSDHEVDWLYNLELPFFIASVDRKDSSVKLYCAHRLSNAFITKHDRQVVKIIFNDNITDDIVEKDDPIINIGPPVLKWSIASLEKDKAFISTFYDVLKEHVKIYKKNLSSRDIGWTDLLNWKTNEPPNVYGKASAKSRSYPERIQIAEDALDPFLANWLNELQLQKEWNYTAESVYSLMKKMRSYVKGEEQE